MNEKEALRNLIRRFPDFESWSFSKQLPLLAWFVTRVCQKEEFSDDDIRRCLKYLDFKTTIYLLPVEMTRCPDLIKTGLNYKLRWRTCDSSTRNCYRLPPQYKSISF